MVLALLAIPTLARAHGDVPFTEPNVVHGCRSTSKSNAGALRQITTGTCTTNEVIVHWHISGAQGPQGETGPQGPQGEKGDPGTGGTATRAAGPCFDMDNRYVDCGNGTVTDTVTGLIWLKQTDCLGFQNWVNANAAAAALANGACGLTDGSSPGDWRLPTQAEWTR
jgi:hypothetical protein